MTTRTLKKSTFIEANSSVSKSRVENSWIMLIKESLFQNNGFNIITLPHPAHGNPAKFCLDNDNKRIYEIITFSEPYRSWFLGDSVKSDGSLMLATPVNPIFLVLPRLKDLCCNRAVPLEDMLSEKGFDKITDFVDDLNDVADMKGLAELKAYKYNEDKTVTWLETRICRLAKVLKNKNIHVTSGAKSATFVSSNLSDDCIDEEFYLKYAHGIISEYLQDDLVTLLEKKFNFKSELIETVGKKRKSEASDVLQSNKKIKSEPLDEVTAKCNDSSFVTDVKKQKTTAKEKARQKAASGTKTISSFFTKK